MKINRLVVKGHSVSIAMGMNCAPVLADMFVFSYETEFSPNI